MIAITTHYDRLGIRPDATPDEVREAYRRLARQHHPDARGGAASPEMADINAAWRALSDPARRAMYDASLRPPAAGAFVPRAPASRLEEERYPVSGPPAGPSGGRFPFGAFAGLVLVAMVLTFIASGIANRDGGADPVDPIMRQGDCVVIEPNLDARKVRCDGAHDGVVSAFVPFDDECPAGTAAHRDRQGMGTACITRTDG